MQSLSRERKSDLDLITGCKRMGTRVIRVHRKLELLTVATDKH